MQRFLEDWFKKISEIPNKEAFLEELISFGKGLGFDLVSYSLVPKARKGMLMMDNHPPGWHQASTYPAEELEQDPIWQSLLSYPTPCFWNSNTFEKSGTSNVYDHVRQFGFEAGIEIPLHQADGSIYLLSLARNKPLPSQSEELMSIVARAQLFAQLASQAAPRLFLKITPSVAGRSPILTKAEHEVLHWTKHGKTAWEISMILARSERTVNFHIQNILRKLDVGGKQMAVFRALELGLIS